MIYMMLNIKYIKIFVLIIFLFPITTFAYDKEKVTLSKCIDGDTARFILNGEEIKVRFLGIDTPETKHPTKGEEPFGKKASNYTCNKLTKAEKIEIEYDEKSNKLDRYDRHLAWVFVDDKLLQNELVKKGYAEVKYLYGNYKYADILKESEEKAKKNKVGIYSLEEDNSSKEVTKKEYDYEKDLKKLFKKLLANILEEIFG